VIHNLELEPRIRTKLETDAALEAAIDVTVEATKNEATLSGLVASEAVRHRVIHVRVGTTQRMKMSCSGLGANAHKSPMAPFVKGGGPQDRGILAPDTIFIRAIERAKSAHSRLTLNDRIALKRAA
jgi:hypothetical protein